MLKASISAFDPGCVKTLNRTPGRFTMGGTWLERLYLLHFLLLRVFGKSEAASTALLGLLGGKMRGQSRYYAAIAAISGLMPMIFITRVRL
jgi:hypothetical protein